MTLKVLCAIFALGILQQDLFAKEWHGIAPLKSTRAEVERLLGKPNELGRYQLKGESASIIYSDGPCEGLYRPLQKDNCKCLVPKDTVLSIYVEPDQTLSFSRLRIDRSKFTKTPIVVGPGMFSYFNRSDGLMYTVDESEDEVLNVEYLPSAEDCQRIIASKASMRRNSWLGLVPLHSDRRDVERVLGVPRSVLGSAYVYGTENERITVKYTNGSCGDPNIAWNVPTDTVLELTATPLLGFLLRNINLDLSVYQRQELAGLPEIPHPPKFLNYINHRDGVTIRAKLTNGDEEVISVTYGPSLIDDVLRCHAP